MAASTEVFTSAGSTIAVSAAAPATYDQAGFDVLTFTTIGKVSDMGEFGREYAEVTFNALGERKTEKRKGSYNDGNLSLSLARVPGDAGHILLLAALAVDDSYAFEVTLQDGTIMYFTAQTMSYKTGVGSTDQITTATCNLAIDNDIIEVAPA